MAGDEEQMLDRYIHDYLVKRNFNRSAQIFAEETNVDTRHGVEIDNPEGFLREWWSNYYEEYRARVQTNNTGLAESSSMAPNRMGDELQIIDPPERKRQRIEQSPDITAVLVQPTASSIHPYDLRSDFQRRHYEAHAHVRPSASNASHQQMQVNNRPQQQNARVNRRSSGVRVPVPVGSTPHGAINPRPAHLNAGINYGVGLMPQPGWPLTGVGSGPVSSGMGSQVLNSTNFLHQQQQIQALANYPQTSLMPTSSQLQGGSTSHLNAGNNYGVGPMPQPGWPLTGVGSGPVSSGMGTQVVNNMNFLQQQQQIQALANYPQTSLIPTCSQHELQIIYPPEMKRQRIEQSHDITAVLGQPTASSIHPYDLCSDFQHRHYEAHAHIMPSTSNASHQQTQVLNRPQQQQTQVFNRPQQQDARVSSGVVPVDSTPHGATNPRSALLNAVARIVGRKGEEQNSHKRG